MEVCLCALLHRIAPIPSGRDKAEPHRTELVSACPAARLSDSFSSKSFAFFVSRSLSLSWFLSVSVLLAYLSDQALSMSGHCRGGAAMSLRKGPRPFSSAREFKNFAPSMTGHCRETKFLSDARCNLTLATGELLVEPSAPKGSCQQASSKCSMTEAPKSRM